MQVVLKDGPMDKGLLNLVPEGAHLLYCTFIEGGNAVRWTAWVEGESFDKPLAMEIEEGQSVYVYQVDYDNPEVQFKDGEDIGAATLFKFLSEALPSEETEEVDDE